MAYSLFYHTTVPEVHVKQMLRMIISSLYLSRRVLRGLAIEREWERYVVSEWSDFMHFNQISEVDSCSFTFSISEGTLILNSVSKQV
ncbi:hypothetical protein L1987_45609 [Smallanthus sonchifolius]|uniref:Uncharacterized protein n=1 Tax=Smallanthus sonchifolius TaxID=185202 RepID=A0ACB9FXC3_9ASTR|nr:hypothetical protein L1987_45609 [Smallanthus sonchifolius]